MHRRNEAVNLRKYSARDSKRETDLYNNVDVIVGGLSKVDETYRVDPDDRVYPLVYNTGMRIDEEHVLRVN